MDGNQVHLVLRVKDNASGEIRRQDDLLKGSRQHFRPIDRGLFVLELLKKTKILFVGFGEQCVLLFLEREHDDAMV